MNTISPVELVWTAVNAVALAFSLWALSDALGDRRFLRMARLNGKREIVAGANIRLLPKHRIKVTA